MDRCFIISGGELSRAAMPRAGDLIIACDRGYAHALSLGVTPDLIIGDFDSYPGALPPGIATQTLPCEKDDTDTMHAVKYAVGRGFKEIVLTCALGGRFDHAFANVQSCAYALSHGVDISMADDRTDIRFLRGGSLTLPRIQGRYLSLFALSQRCTGVNISGVKYPLRDAVLECSYPLGVSNEWTEDQARISVDTGILMIVTAE